MRNNVFFCMRILRSVILLKNVKDLSLCKSMMTLETRKMTNLKMNLFMMMIRMRKKMKMRMMMWLNAMMSPQIALLKHIPSWWLDFVCMWCLWIQNRIKNTSLKPQRKDHPLYRCICPNKLFVSKTQCRKHFKIVHIQHKTTYLCFNNLKWQLGLSLLTDSMSLKCFKFISIVLTPWSNKLLYWPILSDLS